MGDGGTGRHVQKFTDAFTPGFAHTRSLAYARARLELPRRKAGEGTQLTRPFEAAQVAQLHAHGYGSGETRPMNTLGQCDVLAERFSLRDLLARFGFKRGDVFVELPRAPCLHRAYFPSLGLFAVMILHGRALSDQKIAAAHQLAQLELFVRQRLVGRRCAPKPLRSGDPPCFPKSGSG